MSLHLTASARCRAVGPKLPLTVGGGAWQPRALITMSADLGLVKQQIVAIVGATSALYISSVVSISWLGKSYQVPEGLPEGKGVESDTSIFQYISDLCKIYVLSMSRFVSVIAFLLL